jgi:hypothetical protein
MYKSNTNADKKCEAFINTITNREFLEFGLEISVEDLKQKFGEDLNFSRTFRYIPEVGIIVMDTIFREFYDENSQYVKVLNWMNNKFLNVYYNYLARKRPTDLDSLYNRPMLNQLSTTFTNTYIFTPGFTCITLNTIQNQTKTESYCSFNMTGFESSKIFESPFIPLGYNTTDAFSKHMTGYIRRDLTNLFTVPEHSKQNIVELHTTPEIIDTFLMSISKDKIEQKPKFRKRHQIYTALFHDKFSEISVQLNWLADYILLKSNPNYITNVSVVVIQSKSSGRYVPYYKGYTKSKEIILDNVKSIADSGILPNFNTNTYNNLEIDIHESSYLMLIAKTAIGVLDN